jgi:hypothetical protein
LLLDRRHDLIARITEVEDELLRVGIVVHRHCEIHIPCETNLRADGHCQPTHEREFPL